MQGFNMGRYVPPELEGTKISGNSLHRRAAPGTTRPDGSQTVRFEMPFPIWCSSCPKDTIIGQGVRFNAKKVPAGKYYSTPIWSFHLRHADCGGEIVIRTDPKNTAYVVVSGARKRDLGPASEGEEGGRPILTDQERQRLRSSAFASLEKTIADREQLIQANERIGGLLEVSSRQWDDPYAQNQRLRNAFRKGRHQRERDAVAGEELKDRLSFGYDLLPATEEDARRAALVDFDPEGGSKGIEGARALAKPLFQTTTTKKKESTSSKSKTRGVLKAEKEASARKKGFVSEVMGNTRLAQDPFLNSARVTDTKGPPRLPGVKRKRPLESEEEPQKQQPEKASDTAAAPPPPAMTVGLVDYDSS
ncbi:unnamed protein product [Clonostachys byssicola]|uniref:Coiled-coil domain-containing protein 130 n=1 Tax=Clonostachys byssicola TaxID=160290 RepID=A0A9N9Y5D5_9HYPO|nr:unnamed protein product [Clonostachys byssicola]